MKITFIFLFIGVFSVSASSYSQEAKVTMNIKNKSLYEVITTIKSQTTYSFWFDAKDVDVNKQVSIKVKNESVKNVLAAVLEGQNLDFNMNGNHIVISKKKETANNKEEIKLAVQNPIKGIILDENGEPVIGASVVVKGTTNGTIADTDGHFSIKAESKDILLITYIGYLPQEIAVGNNSELTIILKENDKVLDEVVVIGYGTTKKASLTAAISSVKGQESALKPVTNLTHNMGGRLSGVIARQGSGEPGYDAADILVRGKGTTGSSGALIVVDGVPRGNFSQLDPATIESITILKDAAAVAPYGLGGANGVVLVTTKKGNSGAPTFSYNGYVGFQNPTRIMPMVNSYEYALLQNEAARNSGLSSIPFSDADIANYRKTVDGAHDADPDRYPNSRGLKDVLRRNAVLTYHNLELSGGSDRVNYYVSLAYTSQEGQFETTNMKRYNAQSRIDMKATSTTDISLSLSGYVLDLNFPPDGAVSIMYATARMPANQAIYYSNGLWGSYLGRSPVAIINHAGYTKEDKSQMYTTLTVEQKLPFLKGLSIKGLASYDPYTTFKKEWRIPQLSYTPDYSTTPYTFNKAYRDQYYLNEGNEDNKRFTFQGYLNYQNTFGLHAVSFLGVAERIEGKRRWNNAKRTNFPINIDELDQGGAGPGEIGSGGSSEKTAQVGFVYRAGYIYNNRYMFEAAGRYDGSYYFAPGEKWAFFPSFSLGWNVSEENFIKNNFSNLELLKLRASYGESGNLAGSAYQYLSGYSLRGNSAYFGTATTGIGEMRQANPFITWEKAKKTNIGVDGLLWRGLLSFSIDYFHETRSNMLMKPSVTVPLEYGIGLPDINSGKMSNQGIELTISSTHTFPNKLRLDLVGNFTYAHNKLKQVYETGSTFNNPNKRRTGRAYQTQFGYKALGYFSSDDFAADGKLKPGIASIPDASVHPGDIKYADLSGPNGVPDGIIDSNDETVIGKPENMPQIIYGFSPTVSWKGFDLNMLIQGAASYDIYISGNMANPFNDQGSATKLMYDDHWTPENTNATYPRVTSQPVNHNTVKSSHWMRNAAYVRLKSLELGYTLPKELTRKVAMQRVRLYAAGQNLWTWTPFMKEKIDPEAGNTNGLYYFQQSAYSFGLNVTF